MGVFEKQPAVQLIVFFVESAASDKNANSLVICSRFTRLFSHAIRDKRPGSVRRFPFRDTGCLPFQSCSIPLRHPLRPQRKSSSTDTRLHRTTPCSPCPEPSLSNAVT